MLRPLLAVLIAIAFACPCSLPANEPSPATTHGDILADSLHPLDSKEAARARFAALQAPTSKLAEDKLGAAEYSLAARFGNFWAGRGTLDFLLGACLHYAEAAGALAPDGPGQAAIHETVWSLATIVEEINTFRYVAGRIPIQDLAQTTAFRLQAQRFLRRSWVPLVQQGTRARWLLDVERIFDEASYPFPEKALAKAKFQATQTSEQELLQGMQAAARAEQVERFREFHAGRGTLDFLLESAVRSAQARLAASTSPGERLVALETLWNACREIERVNRFRFEAGRIPVQDYAESQYHRRHAEVLVRAVRAKTDQSKATPLIPESDLPWRYDRHETNYLKDYAKDRRALIHDSQAELQRARWQAARQECHDRGNEFFNGRGTLDFLLCSTLRLLDAELALAANDEARWFGLRAHWLRTYQIEQTCRQRMEAGRLPFKEHLETLYHRRDAELWLKQFLTDKKLPVPTPLRFRLESRGCP